jgi:NAD-dependent deacetylase sirtuin 2
VSKSSNASKILKYRFMFNNCKSLIRKIRRLWKKEIKMSGENTTDKPEAKKPESEEPELEEAGGASGAMSVESLRKYLSDKLGIHDKDEEEKIKILDDVSMDGIVDYIKKKNCKNIITMAGAGISTSAGIPDFRSPGSGLYHNLQKYNLPHPQAIFELNFFHENPKPFFELAKELYPGCFKPTICHYFIKLLIEKNILLRHYTQNIDTLERVAGIPEDKIVEAHGTFYTGHCLKCRKEYKLEWMKERIFKDEVPECEKRGCKGVVKPDIIFFGEALPHKFYTLIEKDFTKCDLLIILGSSLAVQPFASLTDRVPKTCPRLLINREKAGQKSGIMAMLGFGGGLDFDGKDNTRDVAWLGDCDDGCLLLADKLSWGDELKKLRETEIENIEKSSKPKSVKSSM